MSTKLKNLFLASIIVASTLVNVFSFTPALAKTNAQMTPKEQAQSYSYYFALAECFDNDRMASKITASDGLIPKEWFRDGSSSSGGNVVAVGHLIDPEDGERECHNLITGALTLWGYAGDYSKALRDFGYTLDGDGNYVRPSNLQTSYRNAIKTTIYAGNSPVLNGAALYQRALLSFVSGCKATSVGEWSKLTDGQRALVNDPKHYKVTIVAASPDGKTAVATEYLYKAELEKSRSITMYERDGGGVEQDECQTLAADTAKYAAAYKTYAQTVLNDGGTLESATPATTNPGDREVCNLTGVGWFVCPIAYLLAGITDAAYKFISNMLEFTPTVQAFDTTNPVYTIWSAIRNIANVAFVFAFFFIIFSQATSIGIGSYGIKKMLPRLIIAAILVNLSYFICMFAVDVSNIIGTFIYDAIRSALPADATNDPATWSSTLTGILTGGAIILGAGAAIAASGGIVAALAAALPFLVIALFAVVTALVVLIARQALIVILVIIAPLAFVAYILPNTENMFDKWRKLFTTLLVFFPLVAIVFGGSAVAASVVRLTFTTENIDGDISAQFARIGSLAIQAFPLFALPFLLKFSGGVLGRLGGVINNPNKGPFDSLRKRAEQNRDRAQARGREQALKNPRPTYTGRLGGTRTALANSNPFSARRAAQSTVDRERALNEAKQAQEKASGAYYTQRIVSDDTYANRMAGGTRFQTADPRDLHRIQTAAQAAEKKAFNDRVASYQLSYSVNAKGADTTSGGYLEQQFSEAVRMGNQEQAAATLSRMANLGAGGREAVRRSLDSATITEPGMKQTISNSIYEDNFGALVGKVGDVAKGSFDGTGKWNRTGAIQKLGSEQLATQDLKTLQLNRAFIRPEEAHRIVNDQELTSKVQSTEALEIFQSVARTYTPPPTPPTPTPPTPPTPPPSGSPTT